MMQNFPFKFLNHSFGHIYDVGTGVVMLHKNAISSIRFYFQYICSITSLVNFRKDRDSIAFQQNSNCQPVSNPSVRLKFPYLKEKTNCGQYFEALLFFHIYNTSLMSSICGLNATIKYKKQIISKMLSFVHLTFHFNDQKNYKN